MNEIFEQRTELGPGAVVSDTLNAHRIAAWERFGGDAECVSTMQEPTDNGGCVITTKYRAHPGVPQQ